MDTYKELESFYYNLERELDFKGKINPMTQRLVGGYCVDYQDDMGFHIVHIYNYEGTYIKEFSSRNIIPIIQDSLAEFKRHLVMDKKQQDDPEYWDLSWMGGKKNV